MLYERNRGWYWADCPQNSTGFGVNSHGTIVGATMVDGFRRPWLKRLNAPVTMLSYFRYHNTMPTDISDHEVVVGTQPRITAAMLSDGMPRNIAVETR